MEHRKADIVTGKAPEQQSVSGGARNKQNSVYVHKKMLVCAIALVVLVLVGLIWMVCAHQAASRKINKKEFQAVFLTNGQTYFGKLSSVNDRYIELTDIYYLQVQQPVQSQDQKASTDNSNVSLAKLGNELHSPEDKMMINRDQVLFWENLKDGGKVTTAIHKNEQKK